MAESFVLSQNNRLAMTKKSNLFKTLSQKYNKITDQQTRLKHK